METLQDSFTTGSKLLQPVPNILFKALSYALEMILNVDKVLLTGIKLSMTALLLLHALYLFHWDGHFLICVQTAHKLSVKDALLMIVQIVYNVAKILLYQEESVHAIQVIVQLILRYQILHLVCGMVLHYLFTNVSKTAAFQFRIVNSINAQIKLTVINVR